MNVVVMGQGYVGLPLAVAAAKAGHKVTGFETDKARYDQLVNCASYIEDVPSLDLMEASAHGTYKPSTDERDMKGFDLAVITVPTPLKKGIPDLSYVSAAVLMLSDGIKQGATIILESTVAPGTTRNLVVGMIERNTGWTAGEHFHVGFSPERIDPGNRTWKFENTPKIVSGLTEACLLKVMAFYQTITAHIVPAETIEEAELAKVFENTYRHVNIALVNELQRHARKLGTDVYNVLHLCGTKPFGFTKFLPGPGVGGHCLPVDPVYLSHQLRTEFGAAFRLVELAQEINDSQPAWVVHRLQAALNKRGIAVQGSRILVLGQAYKADTADMRESPAVMVVELLRELGAEIDTVDPHYGVNVPLDGYRDLDYDGLKEYDAVVLLTPHSAFDLQAVANSGAYVLDTRGVLPVGDNIERL